MPEIRKNNAPNSPFAEQTIVGHNQPTVKNIQINQNIYDFSKIQNIEHNLLEEFKRTLENRINNGKPETIRTSNVKVIKHQE